MSNPIHVSTVMLKALLDAAPTRIDYQDQPEGILVAAIHRAANDLEGQGPRSARVALQLLKALARYEFERELESALQSDEPLTHYADSLEETEELPAEMAQKLAEQKLAEKKR